MVTLRKTSHTNKNGSQRRKMGHNWKNRSHLENWVPVTKQVCTWKNGSHLEKWVTLWKMCHILKNRSHLKNMIRLGKMGHTYNNASHFQKGVALWSVGHIYQIGSHWKNGSHGLEKWVTFKRICHTWKNGTFFKISTSDQHTATDLVNLFYFLRPVSFDHTDFVKEFEQDG